MEQPSPIGATCSEENPAEWSKKVPQRYRTNCLAASLNGTAVADVVLSGTVLYADSGIAKALNVSERSLNEYWSMYINTTQPTQEAVRAFLAWQRHTPEMVMLHSSLRDLYHMCRHSAPGAPEAKAAAAFAARSAALTAEEEAAYTRNLGQLLGAVRSEIDAFRDHNQSSAPASEREAVVATTYVLRTMPPIIPQRTACLRNATLINGFLAQFNALIRRVAADRGLAVMDWERWLAGWPPERYCAPISSGPHLTSDAYRALFNLMMFWYERRELRSANHRAHGRTQEREVAAIAKVSNTTEPRSSKKVLEKTVASVQKLRATTIKAASPKRDGKPPRKEPGFFDRLLG